MTKLVLISGQKIIKRFERMGYQTVRQKGSHVRMRHKFDKTKNPLTIPKHKLIGRGLLRKLLRDADISIKEFNKLK